MAGLSASYINNRLAVLGTTNKTKDLILHFLNSASPTTIAGIEPKEGPVFDDPDEGYGDQVRDYDIATAMGTSESGTVNSGQVAGYESLSKNCLNATYDTSATWNETNAEIDANRPVKSGVPAHARACAGWKRQNLWIYGQQPKRWLRIFDPWPWNANICSGGQVYWEDWDTKNHTNWIYVRHRSTACSKNKLGLLSYRGI